MVLRDQANQYDANASLSERKADGKEVIEQSEAERKDLSLLISEKACFLSAMFPVLWERR